ncbi:hypothetical protein BAR153v2_011120 [Bartonella sp. AR 15-3]|nr:hypothetical protein BAR153v2_011120 [Bartonella sp. AR 15-3]
MWLGAGKEADKIRSFALMTALKSYQFGVRGSRGLFCALVGFCSMGVEGLETLDTFGCSSGISSAADSVDVCTASCSICLICSTALSGVAVVLTPTKGLASISTLETYVDLIGNSTNGLLGVEGSKRTVLLLSSITHIGLVMTAFIFAPFGELFNDIMSQILIFTL